MTGGTREKVREHRMNNIHLKERFVQLIDAAKTQKREKAAVEIAPLRQHFMTGQRKSLPLK